MPKSLNLLKSYEYKKLVVFLSFSVFFIIGCSIYNDYGISTDEPFHRLMGFYWLNYIAEHFPQFSISENINLTLYSIRVSSFEIIANLEPNDFVYGIIFDVPLAFIEVLFNIKDPKIYFELRHLLNFLLFFLSSIFFYKILLFRFVDWKLSLIGTFFLILSPRIFANSFYNNKDLIFLSLLIISIFFALKFLKNANLINSFYFAFFAALCTSSRILGILLVFIIIIFFLITISTKYKKKINDIKFILFSISLYVLFTIFLWPYLWDNPLKNFVNAFKIFTDYPRHMYLLYNASYIKTNALPWHYSINWIVITTPIIYLIFFIIGYFSIFLAFAKRFVNIKENSLGDDLWENFNQKIDLFIFFFFTLSLFLIIKFDAVLYNGWRQIYFVYPLFIYIAVLGLSRKSLFLVIIKKNSILLFLIGLYLLYIASQIFLMHPLQNVYFNALAEKNVHQKYPVDYWGLANRRFLEKIMLIERNKNKINIGISSFTTMDRSINLLEKEFRNKINIVGQEYDEADYIFTNFMSEVNKNIDKKKGTMQPENIFHLSSCLLIKYEYIGNPFN